MAHDRALLSPSHPAMFTFVAPRTPRKRNKHTVLSPMSTTVPSLYYSRRNILTVHTCCEKYFATRPPPPQLPPSSRPLIVAFRCRRTLLRGRRRWCSPWGRRRSRTSEWSRGTTSETRYVLVVWASFFFFFYFFVCSRHKRGGASFFNNRTSTYCSLKAR